MNTKFNPLRRAINVAVLGTTLLSAGSVFAQADITRIVVAFPPGGPVDFIARTLAQQLSKELNQNVIVENKPGASGITGNDLVAKSAPDGYTMLIGITAMIQTPALYAKLPYDVLKDFAPVSQIAMSSDLFVVPRDVPAKTLPEFIALAKAHPGKYSYGNYGNGTSSHMHGELLKMKAGVDLTAIPYKGAAPLVNDVLGGSCRRRLSMRLRPTRTSSPTSSASWPSRACAATRPCPKCPLSRRRATAALKPTAGMALLWPLARPSPSWTSSRPRCARSSPRPSSVPA